LLSFKGAGQLRRRFVSLTCLGLPAAQRVYDEAVAKLDTGEIVRVVDATGALLPSVDPDYDLALLATSIFTHVLPSPARHAGRCLLTSCYLLSRQFRYEKVGISSRQLHHFAELLR
jgi:hypothetical protein